MSASHQSYIIQVRYYTSYDDQKQTGKIDLLLRFFFIVIPKSEIGI